MTLAERAIEALRKVLIDGTFKPSSPLTEREACKLLGMSRSPIRTAFQTLANKGLLLHEPKCGYRVRKVSMETVAEAYLVRGALEALACRLLASIGMSSKIDKNLSAFVEHGRLLLDNKKVAFHHDKWREMNSAFHLTILESTKNEALMVAFHTAETHPMASVRSIPTLDSQPDFISLGTAQSDHEHILSALRARDAIRAASRMREHVEIAGEILVRNLRDQSLLTQSMKRLEKSS